VETGQLIFSVDALGRGRVIGTYAEVIDSESVRGEALRRLSPPDAVTLPAVNFRTTVLAESMVIQVTAESFDPQTSADAANMLGQVGIEQLATLYPMYIVVPLTGATPPLTPYRPDPVRNYAIGALLGLTLAVGLTYLYDTLGAARRDAAAATDAIGSPVGHPAAAAATAQLLPSWRELVVRTGTLESVRSLAERDGDDIDALDRDTSRHGPDRPAWAPDTRHRGPADQQTNLTDISAVVHGRFRRSV
jgi:hypothetical protein